MTPRIQSLTRARARLQRMRKAPVSLQRAIALTAIVLLSAAILITRAARNPLSPLLPPIPSSTHLEPPPAPIIALAAALPAVAPASTVPSPASSAPAPASPVVVPASPAAAPVIVPVALAGEPASPAAALRPATQRTFHAPSLHSLTPLQHDVRNVTRTLYRAYLRHCLGHDDLVPATSECNDWVGMGLTMLDSVDTLVLMRLDAEYAASRAWVAHNLTFASTTTQVSTFEVTIRALAGLTSAYQLTDDALWLDKAVELGDALLPAFRHTPTRCPPRSVYLASSPTPAHPTARSALLDLDLDLQSSNPAEAGTLQLEFRTLSRLTGDGRYGAAADLCMDALLRGAKRDALVSDHFSLRTGQFDGALLALGGAVDSFYEMLLKTWVAFGKRDDQLRWAFQRAVERAYEVLVRRRGGYVYVGTSVVSSPEVVRNEMEHLTCFFPGTLAYAALHGLGGGVNGTRDEDYLPRARELTRSCHAMSAASSHGLATEQTVFSDEGLHVGGGSGSNLLRPEIVEALYYMDQIDPEAGQMYKKWGEGMWKAMRKVSQVPGMEDGVLSSVHNVGGRKRQVYHSGVLHSFVIAETFKYLFLLFDDQPSSDSSFPLDRWVYNTEAHPVRIVEGRR